MRHLVLTIAVIAVLAGTAIVAAPALVSTRLVEAEIAERIGELAGGSVTFGEEPEFSVIPSPRLTLRDVEVSDPDSSEGSPLLTISAMDVSLAVIPLLMGQVKAGTLTLTQPRIHLAMADPDPPEEAALMKAFKAALAGGEEFRLREIILQDATVTYDHGGDRQTHPIPFARLRLGGEDADAPVSLSASVPWCGKLVAFDAELDDPAAAFSGDARQLRIAAAVEPLPGSESAGPGLAGEAAVTTEQALSMARRLARNLGMPAALSTILGQLDVAGEFAMDGAGMTLSDATFEFGGNVAEGNLRIALRGERPAFRTLLSPDGRDGYLYAKLQNATSLAELRLMPVSMGWLSRADVDLELSTERLGLAGVGFTATALSFVSRDGRMNLDIDGEGGAGANMSAQLAVEQAPVAAGGETSFRMTGALEDVSVTHLGQFVWSQWGHPLIGVTKPPEGMGALEFDFSSRGDSIGGLLVSLDGYADLNIRDGSLGGADIVATLEQLLDGEKVMIKGEGPFLPVGGRTAFRTFATHLEVGSGAVRIENFRIAGDRYVISLSGTGDLVRGSMEAEGTVSLYEAGSDSDPRQLVELPFGVGGTIREPMVAPGVPQRGERTGRIWMPEPIDRLRLVRKDQNR